MTLPLDRKVLAAAYTYLRTTEPFNEWGLPPASKVVFEVNKTREAFCDYSVMEGGSHRIRVSENKVGHTYTLMAGLSHEMCHMADPPKSHTHGAAFRAAATKVCRIHGFDPKSF